MEKHKTKVSCGQMFLLPPHNPVMVAVSRRTFASKEQRRSYGDGGLEFILPSQVASTFPTKHRV